MNHFGNSGNPDSTLCLSQNIVTVVLWSRGRCCRALCSGGANKILVPKHPLLSNAVFPAFSPEFSLKVEITPKGGSVKGLFSRPGLQKHFRIVVGQNTAHCSCSGDCKCSQGRSLSTSCFRSDFPQFALSVAKLG